jgi:pyruvate formate lyase activating enzyme
MCEPDLRAEGVVFDVQRWSTEDGPGIRTTVFFKGCPLLCAWCSNPESWSFRPELGIFADRCRHCGACVSACSRGAAWPASVEREACDACGFCASTCPYGARQFLGQRRTAAELLAQVQRDRVFHRRSGGGVTFSGGEATAQPALLCALAESLHAQGVHLALETCGHFDWEANEAALRRMDLVYLDLKHMDDTEHRRWTGVGTALIHANARKLREAGIPVILRFPLLPGINDDSLNLERTADFARTLGCAIEVLPYHALGLPKHRVTGKISAPVGLQPPSAETLARVRKALSGDGPP